MIDAIFGLLVRHGLTIFGGYLLNQGLVDKNGEEQLISAMITIVGIALSIGHKILVAREAAAAKSVPDKVISANKILQILALCLGLLWTATGCASYLATQYHNNRVQAQHALKVEARDDSVFAGFDLFAIPGYIGAWKEEPGLMTAATGTDILSGLVGYGALKQATKSGGGGDPSSTLTGDDNTVTTSGRDSKPKNQKTTTTTTGAGQ